MLQRLPSHIRSRARELHSDLVDVYGGLVKEVGERMQAGGEVRDCLVKTMLLMKEKEYLDEFDITILASAFMIGGIETVPSPPLHRSPYLHALTECFRQAMVDRSDPCASTYPKASPRRTRPCRRLRLSSHHRG
jgi:hypothetical protein